jgi:hypothetical protein
MSARDHFPFASDEEPFDQRAAGHSGAEPAARSAAKAAAPSGTEPAAAGAAVSAGWPAAAARIGCHRVLARAVSGDDGDPEQMIALRDRFERRRGEGAPPIDLGEKTRVVEEALGKLPSRFRSGGSVGARGGGDGVAGRCRLRPDERVELSACRGVVEPADRDERRTQENAERAEAPAAGEESSDGGQGSLRRGWSKRRARRVNAA